MPGSPAPAPSFHLLDLSGEVCPYTYVRTKLALEDLSPGESLCVRVAHAAALENVPRAAALDGHEILSIVQDPPGCWVITIRVGNRE